MNQIIIDQAWIDANVSNGALFFSSADTEYKFVTDFTAPGTAIFTLSSNITIDLDGHTVTFGTSNRSGCIGVNPFKSRSVTALGNDDVNYAQTASSYYRTENITIKNGRIIWGGTTGTWATCVGGHYSVPNIAIDNCYLETGGEDGMCVNFTWMNVTLTNTHALCESASTSNRHQAPACIKTGYLNATHNILIGGNSSIACGSGSLVTDNLIRQSGFATNGYGIFLYRNENVTAYNNMILPSNGRGVLFNAGENHEVYDNLIVVHENPNAEFGTGLSPPCLRSRYETISTRFENNKCLSIAGGNNTAANGAYLSEYRSDNPTMITGNEFRAVLSGAGRDDQYANAMTFEGHGTADAYSNGIITGNKLVSNHRLLSLSGGDGGCYHDGPFSDNSFEWGNGNDSIQWLTTALAEYNYAYSDTNNYVDSDLLELLKLEALAEVTALIQDTPDDVNRYTFFAGWYDFDSKITLMDTLLGDNVNMEPADVYSVDGHRGAIDIQFGNGGVVEYSLVKATGEGEPVVKVVDGVPVPPDPEPEPPIPPEPEPPDPTETNAILLEALNLLKTIDIKTLNAQEIKDLYESIGNLEAMRLY